MNRQPDIYKDVSVAILRRNLFAKLDTTLFKSIESATTLCKHRGNPYIELVHWLTQLWNNETSDLKYIVRHFNIDFELLERGLSESLTRLPSGASSISDFSYHIELAIERAWVCASLEYLDNRIRSGHLLLALLTNPELRRALITIAPGLEKVALDVLARDLNYITRESPEAEETATDGTSYYQGELPGEAAQAISTAQSASLAQYTTDLTALAREGKLDPVLGRSHEIATMTDILLRRRQNNPLLTGEAGVGKTAIVEGLARAIVAGEVPPALHNVRLLTLDIIALAAGASMKGEFEARLKSVLDEAIASEQAVILFIDEVHTLVGAGGSAGTGDAANLLKPALARGQLRTIGATTWSEFKRHIEKDPALTRRFQVLQVAEPAEETAIAMLRGLVASLEKHHNVWIMDKAIQAAVRLSHRYIPARQLPDKAISLLDTACARIAVTQCAPPAELQSLKWRFQSAKSELELLEKAISFGKNENERQLELTTLMVTLGAEIEQLTERWEQEREYVNRIVSLRQKILHLPEDATITSDEIRQQLAEQEQLLNSLIAEKSLVQAEVNEEIIASIVGDWTGIPVGQMLKDDIQAVMELPARLNEHVIGQSDAINQLSESMMIARTGLADPRKPQGVFMLVGPSGVGKTETALAIAKYMYGGEQNLITINMNEYQEAHTVSSLKGSPPGYVGYGEGGVLTEAVRRRPYSVVLLDEVEKAHPDVHEFFYQVFDKGQMEDGEGRQIDFKNCIILLTSNSGSDLISNLYADKDTAPEIEGLLSALQPELLKIFPAAFLGRVTLVPYLPLQNNALNQIVALHLARVKERLFSQQQLNFEFSEAVVKQIVSQCTIAETGARMLIRYIEQKVMPIISRTILQQQGILQGLTLFLDYHEQFLACLQNRGEINKTTHG